MSLYFYQIEQSSLLPPHLIHLCLPWKGVKLLKGEECTDFSVLAEALRE